MTNKDNDSILGHIYEIKIELAKITGVVTNTAENVKMLAEKQKEQETAITLVDRTQTKHSERLSILAVFSTVMTIIASAIATYLGTR